MIPYDVDLRNSTYLSNVKSCIMASEAPLPCVRMQPRACRSGALAQIALAGSKLANSTVHACIRRPGGRNAPPRRPRSHAVHTCSTAVWSRPRRQRSCRNGHAGALLPASACAIGRRSGARPALCVCACVKAGRSAGSGVVPAVVRMREGWAWRRTACNTLGDACAKARRSPSAG